MSHWLVLGLNTFQLFLLFVSFQYLRVKGPYCRHPWSSYNTPCIALSKDTYTVLLSCNKCRLYTYTHIIMYTCVMKVPPTSQIWLEVILASHKQWNLLHLNCQTSVYISSSYCLWCGVCIKKSSPMVWSYHVGWNVWLFYTHTCTCWWHTHAGGTPTLETWMVWGYNTFTTFVFVTKIGRWWSA